ncbi:MAG: hypothetical protein QOH21_2906 [Acidobacteriota bacterium]|jgi:hypothetical protein|nr:hypothetical protein [Acidobacteriota bacterium]
MYAEVRETAGQKSRRGVGIEPGETRLYNFIMKKSDTSPQTDRIAESAPIPQEAGYGTKASPAQQLPRTIESLRASLRFVGDVTTPFGEWENTL